MPYPVLKGWGLVLCAIPVSVCGAAEGDVERRIDALQEELAEQRVRLDLQSRQLAEHQAALDAQRRTIASQQDLLLHQRGQLRRLEGEVIIERLAAERAAGSVEPTAPAQSAQAGPGPEPTPVGTAPPKTEEAPPEVAAIAEIGGVLTPKGKLIVEPALQLSNSQVNRFTFVGVEILEAFQIGLLEALDTDREIVSPSLTLRFGVTKRLEVEAKLPYLLRRERQVATIPNLEGEALDRTVDGEGIGDAELALHYQLGWRRPANTYYVANLRYKSTTGEGPFDLDRNADGIETELATGSGFHSLEPSLTVLHQSDPAVFFANVGYLWNIEDDVNKTFGEQRVGRVDPGDALRTSFGMGYAVNQRASFTIGYKHDYIDDSETEVNDVVLRSSSLHIGSLLLGFGYKVSDATSLNLNLELGVTADAPDVVLTLRVPHAM